MYVYVSPYARIFPAKSDNPRVFINDFKRLRCFPYVLRNALLFLSRIILNDYSELAASSELT